MHANTEHPIIVTDHDLERLQRLVEQSGAEQLDLELNRATIVEQRRVAPDVVTMNSEVVYEDVTSGARRTVRVVYPKDANASRGWVSVLAPIGSALLGLKVGQQIDWQLPTGLRHVRVVEITYQPEASGDFGP
jgi:regulator of nucleoside diphosphate kinase